MSPLKLNFHHSHGFNITASLRNAFHALMFYCTSKYISQRNVTPGDDIMNYGAAESQTANLQSFKTNETVVNVTSSDRRVWKCKRGSLKLCSRTQNRRLFSIVSLVVIFTVTVLEVAFVLVEFGGIFESLNFRGGSALVDHCGRMALFGFLRQKADEETHGSRYSTCTITTEKDKRFHAMCTPKHLFQINRKRLLCIMITRKILQNRFGTVFHVLTKVIT